MVFGSRASSPAAAAVEAEVDLLPPALKLTSWEDMCTERGGITFIILLMIFIPYFTWRSEILIVGSKENSVNLSYYGQNKQAKQSLFRRFMVAIEKAFVLPFIPSSVHAFVMWIFMMFFVTTIPMAVTRYYTSRWIHDLFAIQGPFNLISMYVLGCEPLNITAIEYTEDLGDFVPHYPPSHTDKWERIDFFLTVHLGVGLLWLCVGFLQIFKAHNSGWSFTPSTNWSIHRGFGKVAFTSVCGHIFMMAWMTTENPVNQKHVILVIYAFMVLSALSELRDAYYYARKTKDSGNRVKKSENKTMHEMHAFFLYARTIMGSGPIRIAAWLLWLVGHFVSPESRLLIDRASCQTYAEQGIGDATDCWRPVALNHILTGISTVFLEVLFLAMKDNEIERMKMQPEWKEAEQEQVAEEIIKKERRKKQAQFEQVVIMGLLVFPIILLDRRIENWLNSDSVNLPGPIEFVIANFADIAAVSFFFIKLMSDPIRDLLYEYQENPPKNASRLLNFLSWLYRLDDEHVKVKKE